MNNEKREEIRAEIIKIIVNSWTFEKLTEEEQRRIMRHIKSIKLYGNSQEQVCNEINYNFMAFILALDYSPFGWREPNKKTI